MAQEYKTKYYTFDTELYYARVFEGNRDNGEMYADTEGCYNVAVTLTDEQINDFVKMGVPRKALGYDTFKPLDVADGKMTMRLKRTHLHKRFNNDDGSRRVNGPPAVFDYNKAVEAWKAAGGKGGMVDEYTTPWDMEKDGLLGNGTKAKVKVSIYKGRATIVTLEKIAVVEQVKYDAPETSEPWI